MVNSRSHCTRHIGRYNLLVFIEYLERVIAVWDAVHELKNASDVSNRAHNWNKERASGTCKAWPLPKKLRVLRTNHNWGFPMHHLSHETG
jgi:hypothetical protein